MKFNFNYIALLSAIVFLTACGNDFKTDDNFDLEELPGYVSFVDGTTNNATLAAAAVTEDAGSVSFTIASPTGTLTDVDISYEYSGDAVEGTNYTVDGGSNGTGAITLVVDPEDFVDRYQVDLNVNILVDGVYNRDPQLVNITLTSASNGEGAVAVGRGGTDFLKTATISIDNVDCHPDFSGAFTYSTIEYLCKDAGDPNLTGSGTLTETGDGTYSFDDWSFGVASECSLMVGVAPTSLNFCAFKDGTSVSSGDADMDLAGYAISGLSVSGSSLTMTFGTTDNPALGTTTLTRTDGQDWPADLVQ